MAEVLTATVLMRRRIAKALWCGSLRRRAATCGDLDLAVLDVSGDPDRSHYTAVLKEQLTDAMGNSSYPWRPHLDVRVFSRAEWATGTLHLTGPWQFNVYCRRSAQRLGLSLNEYGLWRADKHGASVRLRTTSEKRACELVGVRYMPPTRRQKFAGTPALSRAWTPPSGGSDAPPVPVPPEPTQTARE
jgi:DNA polymerase (family 10)